MLNYCARLVRLSKSAGRVRQAQIVQEFRQGKGLLNSVFKLSSFRSYFQLNIEKAAI